MHRVKAFKNLRLLITGKKEEKNKKPVEIPARDIAANYCSRHEYDWGMFVKNENPFRGITYQSYNAFKLRRFIPDMNQEDHKEYLFLAEQAEQEALKQELKEQDLYTMIEEISDDDVFTNPTMTDLAEKLGLEDESDDDDSGINFDVSTLADEDTLYQREILDREERRKENNISNESVSEEPESPLFNDKGRIVNCSTCIYNNKLQKRGGYGVEEYAEHYVFPDDKDDNLVCLLSDGDRVIREIENSNFDIEGFEQSIDYDMLIHDELFIS
ncbi:ORF108 [Ostreid herpesvirus 1]|nr:ORF108 [Ostreid herpesvirus 1]WHP53360.1 ORF108 [Ostreid herpesvirus 1]